jgi:HK97 family phage major capsid protein
MLAFAQGFAVPRGAGRGRTKRTECAYGTPDILWPPFSFSGGPKEPEMSIRELGQKRAELVAKAQTSIPAPGKKWTPEARQKFDGYMSEADGLKSQIDDLEREASAGEADSELRQTRRPPESQIGYAGTDSAQERGFRTAFRNFLRHGVTPDNFCKGLSDADRAALEQGQQQYRDMGVGNPTAGGYFVPAGFVYEVEVALKYYGNMLGVAKILDTATGQPLPYPTSNDTSVSGEIVGENSIVTTQDVTIGHLVFGAYKFSTKMVKVSLELAQDSAFNMEQFLVEKFAVRIGRILNAKFTNGVGTTEPTGIITAIVANNGTPSATPTIGTPLIAAGSALNTGGSETGANSIGSSDLFNLEHTVDPLYRPRAKYMMHDQTLRAIKTLLDKYGRPLWVPGVASNAPDTINGYQYSINNDMDPIGASKVSVVFGALEKYLIRRVKELAVLRLVERYAEYGQLAFIGFARYDGNLLDAGTKPVNYLVQHS